MNYCKILWFLQQGTLRLIDKHKKPNNLLIWNIPFAVPNFQRLAK